MQPRNPISRVINSSCVDMMWSPPLDINQDVQEVDVSVNNMYIATYTFISSV